MKIIQITTNAAGNIIALTDTGEIYCGFFSLKIMGDRPEFGWRKAPPILPETYQFKRFKEPSGLELADAIKKAKNEIETTNNQFIPRRPL